jgi:hypothetical protein
VGTSSIRSQSSCAGGRGDGRRSGSDEREAMKRENVDGRIRKYCKLGRTVVPLRSERGSDAHLTMPAVH